MSKWLKAEKICPSWTWFGSVDNERKMRPSFSRKSLKKDFFSPHPKKRSWGCWGGSEWIGQMREKEDEINEKEKDRMHETDEKERKGK